MTHRKSGFTLLELLVVIAIIGVLVAVMITGINSSRRQQEKTATTALVGDLGLAIQQYHQNTQRYPETLKSISSDLLSGAVADWGYLHMLNGSYTAGVKKGHVKMTTEAGGATKYTPQEYFTMKDDYSGPDDDRVYDMWDNHIRYRRCPKNVTDLRKRWDINGTRADVLSFPGNPKGFNLWSPGEFGKDLDQTYRGTAVNGAYKSGGYNDYRGSGDEDYEDDINNW